MKEQENPLIEWIVSALGFVCLGALAIQTWFFIDWLMGPSAWWMKVFTLIFFDIFGGIWLILGLFHTPPTHGTYQMQKSGVVVCFILSASTTICWCIIFITRTPMTEDAIAAMVDAARWIVVFAVLFNGFLMIFYAVKTSEYNQQIKYPHKKRWATEKPRAVYSPRTTARPAPTAKVRVAVQAAPTRPVRQLPTAPVALIQENEADEVELNDSETSEEAEAFEEDDNTEDEDGYLDTLEGGETTEEVMPPLSSRLTAAKQALFPKSGKNRK